jgi:hypothetical protein
MNRSSLPGGRRSVVWFKKARAMSSGDILGLQDLLVLMLLLQESRMN